MLKIFTISAFATQRKHFFFVPILLFFMLQTSFMVGQTGEALNFTGATELLSAPNNSALEFADGTVEMWIKPEAIPLGGSNYRALIGLRGSAGTRWSYAIHRNLTQLATYNGGNSKVWNFTFTAGTWYHLAFVESGTNISAYVNGTLINTQVYGGSGSTTGLPLSIGQFSTTDTYKGVIDEVRIWNVARSGAELMATMNDALCGDETGLVAYYPLNEGVAAGNNAGVTTGPDLSSTNNDASLTNFALSGSTSNWVSPGAVVNTLFDITSTGTTCSGGVSMGLSGSLSGWNYQLQDGGSNIGAPVAGTGSALSFAGSYTSGTFTVEATRTSNNCVLMMNGSVSVSAPSLLYVDATATGSNDGSTWADAFTDLQSALNSSCSSVTQIQVAAGTYKPTTTTTRTISFVMKNGVEILGGYPNGGGTRDWAANPTILSGEIGAAGNSDNSYHVINNTGLTNTAIIDGFVISDGNANGGGQNNFGGGMYNFNTSSPTILNCTFTNNGALQGGGMWNQNSSSPMITNCIFSNNVNTGNGAGMQNQTSSSPTITNCLFVNNSGVSGGGMFNAASCSPIITNCTFADNAVTGNGGGIFNNNASNPTIINSIFWDNGGANEIQNLSSAPTVTYSIVQGGYTGAGNLNIDPLFVDAANGDYNIEDCSGAVDAGDGLSGSSSNTTTTDLAGNARFFNSTVIDMGAYEVQTIPVCCPASGILYVDNAATGDNDGSSWANAYTDLQSALTSSCSGITQIQVAAGTYQPTSGTDRTISFVMKNDLEILGGYPNGGGTRDWTANPTILSGEIGTAGNSDNSYHVINNTGLTNTAIIDGFVIADGNANGGTGNNIGGGMYNGSSAPTILNCTFSNNGAAGGGGMWNQSSSPVITNCIFSNNTTTGNSAGLHNQTSTPTITNCLFSGNNSGGGGGGMGCFAGSSPNIINCTFADNTVAANGGALFTNNASTPVLTNCIAWNNGGALEIAGSATVTYSIVEGGFTGTENLNIDPLFVDAANGNYNIQDCSGAVDAGDGLSGSSSNTTTTDLAGNARFFNSTVIDMGAYEVQAIVDCCPSDGIFYVDHTATGDNNGLSWANAFTDLQSALAGSCSGITQIQVAAGTYKPTPGTNINAFFNINFSVSILGGYPNGGGTTRDWTANPTILSGNLDGSNYSLYIIRSVTPGVEFTLDGLTIQDADGTNASSGGAIQIENINKLFLNNCTLTNNVAAEGAAISSFNNTGLYIRLYLQNRFRFITH